MANTYGDADRRHVAVITLMQQSVQSSHESVRAYAGRVKATQRPAQCNLQKNEEVLHNIAWAGLHNSVKNKVGPMTPACGTFDTLDEIFDMATASAVTHVETRIHSSNNSSNNSSRNILLTRPPKVAYKATGHPSLSQPTQATANPAHQDQTDTANQAAKDNCQAYCWHHGSQRKYSKARVLLAIAYDADFWTWGWACALNTHDEVIHHSRTRCLLWSGEEDTEWNDGSHSTINREKTH